LTLRPWGETLDGMRVLAAAVLVSTLVGCGASSSPPPPARSLRPIDFGNNGVLDLATDFLDTACRAPAGEPFARAWLAHEERFYDVYFPAYYQDAELRADRARLAQDLALRQSEMCGHTRVFRLVAPAMVDALRPEVMRVVGAPPRSPVVFTAALQGTDGKVTDVRGRSVLLLNARHDSFARTENLGLLITHELIHDAQENLYGGRDGVLSPAARVLYREGAAVFGTTLIFPEAGDRALEFSNKELERGRFAMKKAALAMLELVRTRADGPPLHRYVRGGQGDAEMPGRMAYFVGLEIYRAIARERGDLAAARTSPETFGAEIERRLADLGR
jgi:hypothetical protein